jgi:pimeloyl-ACP methyl ester carboxylesterase
VRSGIKGEAVGMGVGYGAHVLINYALKHKHVISALILVSPLCKKAGWCVASYPSCSSVRQQQQRLSPHCPVGDLSCRGSSMEASVESRARSALSAAADASPPTVLVQPPPTG